MTSERSRLDEGPAGPRLRNTPMRPRAWRELLERDDVAVIESDSGALVLVMERGQLTLHYAFADFESMRGDFLPMFDELKSEIASFDAEHVRIDLVQLPDRTWIEPLLEEADFVEFTEWMDMVHSELDPDQPPPHFPDGVAMRRAQPDDAERIVAIEREALNELADGEAVTLERLDEAAWSSVLEREGVPVAYAINGPVERAEGRILSAVVAPEAQRQGLGRLLLAAATYQLIASEARRAVVRVRPEITPALRATQALGFGAGTRGIEWRRPTDESLIAERRARKRVAGVKARFGGWR